MKNLIYNIETKEDYKKELRRNLRAENRTFFTANQSGYDISYQSYLDNIHPCLLERVNPLWAEDDTESKKSSSELYEHKKAFRKKCWQTAETLNGGKDILCPLCEISHCDELDHYIPRENMPEFSVFSPNLIPLCHDCNHTKGTYWLDENQNRLIFNAYFDIIIEKPICVCKIFLVDGFPYAKVDMNGDFDNNNVNELRIKTTIEKLHLVERWQSRCEEYFNLEIIRLEKDYRMEYWHSIEDYWKYKRDCYQDYLKEGAKIPFVNRLLYEGIISSQVMGEWLKGRLNK